MDATFWALVALILFFALIIYLKVPGKITSSLDDRGERIRKDMEEARRMREEAQALLAEYTRKRQDAEKEAEAIIEQAKSEADRLTAETQTALDDLIDRKTKAVEQKIAQAEAQAVAEVRARAADVAVAAAESILAGEVKGKKADDLIDTAIEGLSSRLN